MMQYTQELTLDIFSQNTYRTITAKQGDNASRFVKITMMAGPEKIIPEQGCVAYFRAQKEDGNVIFNYASIEDDGVETAINEDGTVTVELTEQTLAYPGEVLADVVLKKDDAKLACLSFIIQVEPAPSGKKVESTNEFLVLVETTEKALKAIQDAQAATKQASEAAWGADKSRQEADEAEEKRAEAESQRKEAETGRVQAEKDRDEAEGQRDTAEQERADAETQRGLNEEERQTAEEGREQEEEARQTAEGVRQDQESQRQANEQGRDTAESGRVEAEGLRDDAELQRQENEKARQSAETGREEAEAKRVQEHTDMLEEAAGAVQEATEAAGAAQELAEHPNKVQDGTWWVWDTGIHDYRDTGAKVCLAVDVTFPSIADMEAAKDDWPVNSLAMISSGVEDEDNAKLYIRDASGWRYVADLSGFTGVGFDHQIDPEDAGKPGTVDEYTHVWTDGRETKILVYNGKDGTGQGDMVQAVYDPKGKRTDIFAYADEARSRSWVFEAPASGWVEAADAWAGIEAKWKQVISVDGMTADTEISNVHHVSGDNAEGAVKWRYYELGENTVTLYADKQPTADITLKFTEVK